MISVNLKAKAKQQLKFRKTKQFMTNRTPFYPKNCMQKKPYNQLEKENPSHPSKLEGYVKTDSIVEGVGLPEDELKALHTSQNQEIERMFMDIDSIVIDPSEEGTAGITLGQLLALHKQQENEIEKSDDWDKIVIPASEDGSPGLSRAELSALHEQQEHEIANADDWDKIVIPASEDGSPGLSLEELTALQKQQDYETGESSEDPFAPLAPSPSEGGPDMTAHELNELHNNQTLD